MTMKRIDQYKDKTAEELKKAEADLTAEVFGLRFQVAYKQLENPMKLRTAKRDLARVKTLLTQKRRMEKQA
jgi:large subunit ribosomal protein L29